MIKNYLAIIFLLYILPFNLLACGGSNWPTSGGEMVYSIDSTNPLTVHITITLYFDRTETLPTDSVVLDWGDGSINNNAVYAISNDTDFYAMANMPFSSLFAHVYTGSHTYAAFPPGGYYFIGTTGEFHISNINNLDGGSGESAYYIQAQVGMDSTNAKGYNPPVLKPVNLMFSGLNSFSDSMLVQATTGDSTVFELIQPLQNGSSAIPDFLLPSQLCDVADSSFTIDSHTGVITWPHVCVQGIFDVATLITTYRNGKLIGTVMRDQLLYTELGFSSINNPDNKRALNVYPNPTNSQLVVSLPDNNTGQITMYDVAGRTVITTKTYNSIQQTLDVSALPQGAYLLTYQSADVKFSQKIIKE